MIGILALLLVLSAVTAFAVRRDIQRAVERRRLRSVYINLAPKFEAFVLALCEVGVSMQKAAKEFEKFGKARER